MIDTLKRFNVVIVSPDGYAFSETFREIAETLLYGIRRLGHAASISSNKYDEDALNIILGAHLLDEEGARRVPPNSIICNFEQVHGGSRWIKPVYVDLVARHVIWDYSVRNIAMWRRYCPEADVRHVAIGYVPELSRIVPCENEDIDVLFYGVINERRARILDQLQAGGLNVVAVTGVFGRERDALIARAKVVLGMHFFDTRIFELVRVSYLLANRKAVVAEVGADTEIDEDIRETGLGVPYDSLVQKCVELVFDDDLRRAVGERGFQIFSQRCEEEILANALRSLSKESPIGSSYVELPKRINVGSGKGWNLESLNLDVDPMWMPDLVADLNEPLPRPEAVDLGRFGRQILRPGYFDEIIASHVLEHVGDLVTAMESFLRLLRVGGTLVVEVPYDLSHGAWQDPTHVRAMNERSWLYYTEWHWYLGWKEARFVTDKLLYVISDYGRQLMETGKTVDELTRLPRAVDAMQVTLRKVELTETERLRAQQRWLT